jgi:rRNA processing protein Gar1
MKLRPLGVGIGSYAGRIVIRANKAPRIKSAVYDSRGRKVGHVVRVFGPVKRPYVSVQPLRGVRPGKVVGARFLVG